jgi:hypothetical protein
MCERSLCWELDEDIFESTYLELNLSRQDAYFDTFAIWIIEECMKVTPNEVL